MLELDRWNSIGIFRVEVGKGKWSGFSEVTYLGDSEVRQTPFLHDPDLKFVETEEGQIVYDLAGVYWPYGIGTSLGIIAGIRHLNIKDRYGYTQGGTSIYETGALGSYSDFLLGLRYDGDWTEKLGFGLDINSSFGESEGTTQLRATIN